MRADLSFWDSEYAVTGTMVGGTVVYGPRVGAKTLAS